MFSVYFFHALQVALCLTSNISFQSATEEVVSEDDDVPLVSTDFIFFRKYFRCGNCDLFLEILANYCDSVLGKLNAIAILSCFRRKENKSRPGTKVKLSDRPLIQFFESILPKLAFITVIDDPFPFPSKVGVVFATHFIIIKTNIGNISFPKLHDPTSQVLYFFEHWSTCKRLICPHCLAFQLSAPAHFTRNLIFFSQKSRKR